MDHHLHHRTDRARAACIDPGARVLPVPDLLDLPDVVPDERRRSCASRRASSSSRRLSNYTALITGRLETTAGNLDIAFMRNLWNSVLLSTGSVLLSLLLGVPAAYAFARFRFRLGENIAFTLLSFRFAPPLLVLLPLTLYFTRHGPHRHLYRPDLGLSAHLPAADPVDRARLFRGYQPRHRICLSHRRPFLVADLYADRHSAGAARASPRPGCSPSSSPGTISSSR